MRMGELLSVGHNLADSVGSGISLLIGDYDLDIYGEVKRSDEKFIEVDFLNGSSIGARPSDNLAQALRKCAEKALPALCESEGVNQSDFKVLNARFFCTTLGEGFEVSIESRDGRKISAEYRGRPAKRMRTMDSLGRIRRVPLKR